MESELSKLIDCGEWEKEGCYLKSSRLSRLKRLITLLTLLLRFAATAIPHTPPVWPGARQQAGKIKIVGLQTSNIDHQQNQDKDHRTS